MCFVVPLLFFVFLDVHVSRPRAWSQDKIHRHIDRARKPKAWSQDKVNWPIAWAETSETRKTKKNNDKNRNTS